MRIALVAGEASGDALGADLIRVLQRQFPTAEFRGIAGPAMQAAGCVAIAASEELAVMGLVEVLHHLPRLWALRRRVIAVIATWKPDVFIGIDAPEFNLGLCKQFKRRGMRTVQYVSPQVWAWRQGRVRTVARDCDLLLCLLPFEPPFYRGHAVRAEFVGHPLADQIPLVRGRDAARATLGLNDAQPVVALLPGSRMGEVERLGPEYVATARALRAKRPELTLLAPMANAQVAARFRALGAAASGVRLLEGQARTALQAADVALIASGTATLEALLCGCPMLACYRLGALSYALLKGLKLFKLDHFAMPNLLAGEALVEEFSQGRVSADALSSGIIALLDDAPRRKQMQQRFAAIHQTLRQGASDRAAECIQQLLQSAPSCS